MALRVFVLDQVRVYRGGSVYGAATGPDTSPPRYMLNPVPHGALATALPPWFKGRNGPEGKREDKGTGSDL